MSLAGGLLGALLLAVPAFAANPAQDAYGATGATGGAGSLPFTGLNLVAILAVAVMLLTAGLVVRVRAARGR